ncbi:hypothetical protein EDC96DRAFT_517277, partial [Choanephora cucurbitarum]
MSYSTSASPATYLVACNTFYLKLVHFSSRLDCYTSSDIQYTIFTIQLVAILGLIHMVSGSLLSLLTFLTFFGFSLSQTQLVDCMYVRIFIYVFVVICELCGLCLVSSYYFLLTGLACSSSAFLRLLNMCHPALRSVPFYCQVLREQDKNKTRAKEIPYLS